jgi:signal transduction histidine kinase
LVVFAILGSLLIPAHQTLLITRLLRETTEVLAPARVLGAQLQSGLADEVGALQGYALSRDTALLTQFQIVATANDQRLAGLDTLAVRLSPQARAHIATVHRSLDEWRAFGVSLTAPRGAGTAAAPSLRGTQRRYDASLGALANLSADLSAEAAVRDRRLGELEHLSLISNAALVGIALLALLAVLVLTVRERRLSASLRRRAEAETARARQEGALREAAEALAGAFTIDAVTERIAHAALDAVQGRGAFVERLTRRANENTDSLVVGAVAGTGVPPLASGCALAGSYAETVLQTGEPLLITASDAATHGGMLRTLRDNTCLTIAVPLASPATPVGALFVLSSRDHFRKGDVARAATFGHLAALAYEKVRLLDEAIAARRRLEQVITSRSRLMRGFSHDVKNPIGAANGYAELLTDGVYGPLNDEQRESVERMRRCMHGALSLIDDLHELARAETGHLALAPELIDGAELGRDLADEYQAAANAAGLELRVVIDANVGSIRTSRSRVHQIAANLLSNAIKYTDAGSIVLRGSRRTTGPLGALGNWVALEFTDTGRGVPAEKYEFIFQEFSRIGDGDKSGAGLGLAISRLIAHALGGDITIVSALGQGSTFTLWLPREAAVAAAA